MLTIDTIPLWRVESGESGIESQNFSDSQLSTPDSRLFILSVYAVATATTAELFQLQSSRRVLLVLGRRVVALFALSTLQNYIISRHIFSQFSVVSGQLSVSELFLTTDH